MRYHILLAPNEFGPMNERGERMLREDIAAQQRFLQFDQLPIEVSLWNGGQYFE